MSGAVIEKVRIQLLPDGRMTSADAARYLGHDKDTLAKWRVQAKGPRSIKVGGRVFYYRQDLDAFIRGEAAA